MQELAKNETKEKNKSREVTKSKKEKRYTSDDIKTKATTYNARKKQRQKNLPLSFVFETGISQAFPVKLSGHEQRTALAPTCLKHIEEMVETLLKSSFYFTLTMSIVWPVKFAANVSIGTNSNDHCAIKRTRIHHNADECETL